MKNSIKRIITSINIIILIFSFTACEEAPPTLENRNTTVVFVDKSDDKNFSKMVQMKVSRIFNRDQYKLFNRPMDKGEIFFIHNSTSRAGRFHNPIILPDLPDGKNSVLQQRNRNEKYRRLFKGLVKKAVAHPPNVTSGSTAGSDIWSIIYIAQEVFYSQTELGERHIYIISDMKENKPRTRNFFKYPPKTLEEARQFGQEDYERIIIRHPSLRNNYKLKGTVVHIIFTAEILANDDALILEAYWKEIFKRFEMSVIIE